MVKMSATENEAFERLIHDTARDEGAALSDLDKALIRVGLSSAVVSLDREAIRETVGQAFSHGASPVQIQEVISVISGLGVHSLMTSAVIIIEEARAAGYDLSGPLTEDQQKLWDERVGDDPFWFGMEQELPGFLNAMLRLSETQFDAFFSYCSVPWTNATVKARTKELLAMASDAMPAHRFMAGFRLHLANAVKLGAGRRALLEALELARQTPPHRGA